MGRVHPSEVEVEVDSPWRLVMIGALVLVVCDPVAAPAPKAEVVAAGVRPGFAPATVGDSWTYRTTQSSPGLAMPGATSTDTIASGDKGVFRLVTTDAGNPGANNERSLIITPAGVSPDIGVMTTSIGPVKTVKTSGVYLPTDLTPGLRWSWTQAIDSPISTMDVAGSAEVVGTQQVTVPAGTFEAVKIRSETKNHVVTKGGQIPAMDHVQHDESWYVRGLGLVRNVTRTAAGYSADKVLIQYSVQGAPVGQQAPKQVAKGAP
jgi:hypothetical protein